MEQSKILKGTWLWWMNAGITKENAKLECRVT